MSGVQQHELFGGPAGPGMTGPSRGRHGRGGTIVDTMSDMRADYAAGKRSRMLRRRQNLGGTGDSHYIADHEFEQIREYARDMDRNDAVVGGLVDRAVTNQLQGGFRVQPDTGDPGLDLAIRERFAEWGSDPDACDYHAERSFWEACWYALRSTYVDGDMFAVLTGAGTIQLLEGDRLASPSGRTNVVHGVELEGRRKVACWFTDEPLPRDRRGRRGRVHRRMIRDEDGYRQILQLFNPQTVKRISQARGVSAFAPVFYRFQMYEDEQFATLVARQVLANVAVFIERDQSYRSGTAQFGPRSTQQADDGSNTRTLEKIDPAMVIRGAPGEKPHVLSANMPSADVQAHLRHVLKEIGASLGVPLILALMDASETNFSGWRGAYEEAKKAWRVNQEWFVRRFPRPVYLWKVRQWLADGELGQAALNNPRVFRHRWGLPRWPYNIQPLVDAQATQVKLTSVQLSPAEMCREQGCEWEEHADEIVSNWAYAVRRAKREADAINQEFADDSPVHWRELLPFNMPKGTERLAAPATEEPADAA